MIKQKLLTAMTFVALIALNLNGYFVLNETEGAFNPNTCKDCKSYTSLALEQFIVTAASYFIQSNSIEPVYAKSIIFKILPKAQKKRNLATGIFNAPAVIPARSKAGLGMKASARMVMEPKRRIQLTIFL